MVAGSYDDGTRRSFSDRFVGKCALCRHVRRLRDGRHRNGRRPTATATPSGAVLSGQDPHVRHTRGAGGGFRSGARHPVHRHAKRPQHHAGCFSRGDRPGAGRCDETIRGAALLQQAVWIFDGSVLVAPAARTHLHFWSGTPERIATVWAGLRHAGDGRRDGKSGAGCTHDGCFWPRHHPGPLFGCPRRVVDTARVAGAVSPRQRHPRHRAGPHYHCPWGARPAAVRARRSHATRAFCIAGSKISEGTAGQWRQEPR